ncbi:glycoside hydrolase family 19 protein [Niveibacterium sp. SC-1]|uniref:glycoside hydrolase family 19 protein n=1 Tax=Niveibacterium sp. SC-1 TaxID=3135646 RepID=UPI00311EF60D
MTPDSLRQILPLAASRADLYAPHIAAAQAEFDIPQGRALAMFIAQVGHESSQLRRVEENLNYTSAQRLIEVFGKRFSDIADAQHYLGQPERIANRVYAGRFGNGPEASGDGWRYRGRGLIQLTFADNYAAAGRTLFGDPKVLLQNPDRLTLPEIATRAAGWYWHDRKCGAPAAAGDVRAVTRLINGAALASLAEREQLYARACKVLGC